MKTLRINYMAVFMSAIATFVLGAIWYITFQPQWLALTGLTEDKIQAGGGGSIGYAVSFITYLLGAYAMALLFKSMNVSTAQTGALTGALIGALIVGGNIFTNNAYEMKPVELSVLNAGFSAISGAAMGAILGGWRKYT